VAKYYMIAMLAVFVTAISQILLKLGAEHHEGRDTLLRVYLNRKTIGGYVLLFMVTILNTYAFREIHLKMAVVFQPMTFLSVVVLSFWLLDERLSRRQLAALGVIVLGMAVFNL
jgi:drug/metabolite transporter (DMT)-like permease